MLTYLYMRTVSDYIEKVEKKRAVAYHDRPKPGVDVVHA
jgi:hypothetical protein